MLALLVATVALAQATLLEPRFERLDNGLRVAIVEDHTLPLVSVQLWYRIGSAEDGAGQPGLCHLARTVLEHRADAALKLTAAGVRFASRTLRDACYFSSLLPPDLLEYVLDVEAERLQPRPVTPEELSLCRNAAARHYGLCPANPQNLAWRHVLAAMFPDHPYQHPPEFVAESLQNLTPADLSNFVDRGFAPSNATLFVIGDVSHVRGLELIRQRFAALPWRPAPRRSDIPTVAPETIEVEVPGGPHGSVDIVWLAPPAGHFENAALDVLMQQLCNPIDGPLPKRLAAAGIATPPRWRRESWSEYGVVWLSIAATESASAGPTAEPDSDGAPTVNRLCQIVQQELTTAQTRLPTEIQHNRARALARRRVSRERARFGDRALQLATSEIVSGNLLLAEFVPAQIAGVGAADVQQAARTLGEARLVVVHRPASASPTDDHAAAQPRGNELPKPLSATPPLLLASADALQMLAVYAGRSPMVPSRAPPARPTTHPVVTGVTLTVCPVPGLLPIEVRTTVGPGVPAAAVLATGSTRHSLREIRDYISYHGLELAAMERSGAAGLRSQGPPEETAQMIELQAELLRYGARSDSAIRDDEPLQRLLVDLDAIARVHILVVGDVDPAKAREVAAAVWSGWQPAPEAEDTAAVLPAHERPSLTPPTAVSWTTTQPAPLTLSITEHLYPSDVRQPLHALAVECAAWALGASQQASPDLNHRARFGDIEEPRAPARAATRPVDCRKIAHGDLGPNRAWRWKTLAGGDPLLTLTTEPRAEEITPVLDGGLARIRQVRAGELPRAELEVALRLARSGRLTALDSSHAIADFIQAGIDNPWNLLDDHGPDQFGVTIPQAYRVRTRSIAGSGPADKKGELLRFESSSEESPVSP
ncbi:MAG: insulinase family protein [Planctomycetes bacterium]|nr:insulinase family protein [Planctomycetota bacterium]